MSTPTPVVLVHGGGFAGSCWDLLTPLLKVPVIAVDLPGRGNHPAPLDSFGLEEAAESVAADVDAAGFDDIILVGHSLAGCSMPAAIGLLGARVRHAVFVACTVPEDGTSCLDTLPDDIKALAGDASRATELGVLTPEMARLLFGNDLDEQQVSWMLERMVPEAPRLTTDRVDLAPLASTMRRTWVRTIHDVVVPPDRQRRFARNVGSCEVIELDAAHMCMISQPAALAGIINGIARSSEVPHSG
ncbi:MAG TPA: alpha/beta hydrolase [Frankiaceae bacterium]|nr:alpha/beta hydrolase [Frankiaceae bacterium]